MLDKRYDHKEVEERIYAQWEKSGYFNPDTCVEVGICAPDAEPFSIVLPPPNVTGTLHMGHAAMLAIEDIMIRFNRMRGRRTLWLPGTDHAAIATQSKVEKILYKEEKKTRHDLGREAFLRRVEDYAQASHDTIVAQTKHMGASLDWSREAYTLDAARSHAVRTAFKRLYDMGLIYRGNRIVNWDPQLQTTVSDDEIEWVEQQAPFYYLKYGPFTIATARPETKFGDKYVVMHPDDKRYKQYSHGQQIELEWVNGTITATVIKDEVVDMEFGTGVMTITPWHDATDFDIAERHNLDKEQIIDTHGKLLPIAGNFAGMHIKKARPLIVEKLKERGLLGRVDGKYVHRIATNSRGGGIIEPQIMKQWFINVNKKFEFRGEKLNGVRKGEMVTPKELMRKVVETGQIEIIPKRFEKIYFHWIDNLRDWCISRQLWYGHRIPAWYCEKELAVSKTGAGSGTTGVVFPKARRENVHTEFTEPCFVGINPPKACPRCGKSDLAEDPDTLDTWFSSGLWTFSTLGWPFSSVEGIPTDDFKRYHPTSVLETGYDILFFWVARMVLMSTALLGDIPFKQVYLHGMVRDDKGRKMSKSLDNIIDPLDMAEKYSADATRMSLIVGTGPGSDLKLSEDKIRGYRNFATKTWNIARFILMNKPQANTGSAQVNTEGRGNVIKLTVGDKVNIAMFERVRKEVTAHYEKYEFHLAAEKAYHYLWHTFADKIVEASKERLNGENEADKHAAYAALETIFVGCLKLLHPLIPFVTEELYQKFRPGNLLMIQPWN